MMATGTGLVAEQLPLMRYAVWNNKGGVGKRFLSFVLGTEYAKRNPDRHVILVDMWLGSPASRVALRLE